MKEGFENLTFPLKGKYVAMLAPSFVVDFSYPKIIPQLKELGFEKIVELTFGAKMINRDYHKKLKNSKTLVISSVCPGIVETIKIKFPQYKKNLIQIDSPMISMAKICKKIYPHHKRVFIAPCNFKKIEAENSEYINDVIDYKKLHEIFKQQKLENKKYKKGYLFDKFYNDYTKIYPLSGGLSKTAHIKGLLKKEEVKIIDGISNVIKFLNNPNKKIRFLDVTFCRGGCIGGPCIYSKLSINLRKQKVLNYMKLAEKEEIPENKKGLIEKAKGISFKSDI